MKRGKPASIAEDGEQTTAQAHNLRQSQEAYVAFAFAAADLLLETSAQGQVVFAVGASMALVGRPARLLAGSNLADLVRMEDRLRLTKALKRMAGGNRVRHVLVTIEFPNGDFVPAALSGYPHPDRNGRLLCVLTHSGSLVEPPKTRREGGLLGREDFAQLAHNVLSEAQTDGHHDYRMTLLDLPEIKPLREKLGAEKTAEFMSEFSDYLRRSSLGGDAAAELGDTRYGLIHDGDLDRDQIGMAASELASTIAGKPLRLKPATISITLETGGVSSQEAARALAYTIAKFVAEEGQTIENIAKAARPELSATVAQMRHVKDAIDSGAFDLHVQPIVDLWTNAVHHFECLVRFKGSTASPYGTVTFAEDLGLVAELDQAIIRRAISMMRNGPGAEPGLKFAVNVSGRTLASPSAAGRLVRLVRESPDLRGRLLFEVTESAAIPDLAAANAVIQEIRAYGHPVGLDDFGAGSAAFHYLRALKVDHVKIDGSYVRDMSHHDRNAPFLRAISQLCRELKIATIAEHIENENTANLLRVYNVRYGQGFFFGRPIAMTDENNTQSSWTMADFQWRNGLLFFNGRSDQTDEILDSPPA